MPRPRGCSGSCSAVLGRRLASACARRCARALRARAPKFGEAPNGEGEWKANWTCPARLPAGAREPPFPGLDYDRAGEGGLTRAAFTPGSYTHARSRRAPPTPMDFTAPVPVTYPRAPLDLPARAPRPTRAWTPGYPGRHGEAPEALEAHARRAGGARDGAAPRALADAHAAAAGVAAGVRGRLRCLSLERQRRRSALRRDCS